MPTGSKGLDVHFIRESVSSGCYEISLHADAERLVDAITMEELEAALAECEVLEDYPDDQRGHSCLVFGRMPDEKAVHAVCGLTRQGTLVVITVYRPDVPKWIDERTRRKER